MHTNFDSSKIFWKKEQVPIQWRKKKQHILGIVPVEEEGVDSSIEGYVAVETEIKTVFYSPHI